MKKTVFILLCLLNVLVSYGQEIQKKLYTEKDGYRWYAVYGGVFGIQNTDSTYVYYSDDNRYEYSCYYTNFNANSNRSFFWIQRKNKKIIPKKRKERKKYEYIDSTCVAMVKLNGEIVIPFERGYHNVTYMTMNNRDYFEVKKGYKEGICDIHGNEIVEPKYASIFYSIDGFHGNMESIGYDYKKLGIELDENNEVNFNAFNKELVTDRYTNYKYYLTYQSGSFGVDDENGHVLIPLSKGYTLIQTRDVDNKRIVFLCYKDTIVAAHNMNGKEIVPLTLGATSISKTEMGGTLLLSVSKKIDEYNYIYGYYNLEGKAIVPLSQGFNTIFYDDEKGYIHVRKDFKYGAYSLSGKEIVKPQYSVLSYTKDGFVGEKGDGDYQERKLGIYLPNHKSLFPPATKRVAVASYSTKTSSSTSQKTRSNNSTSTKSVNRKSSYSPSSLSYKTWETKYDKGHTEYVRSADGMVDETMYMNCVCLGGTCKICAGLGVTGYGMFQTYCNSCGGSGRCSFCDGTGTKVTTKRYRFIDEYYSNGGVALHVTSSSGGPSVYMGGVGSVYYTYGNSKPIADEGSYYSFGGETVYGVKTNSFRLSKDYKTLWMGNQEYHLVDKAEYDRLAEVSSKIRSGVAPVSSGSSGSAGYSGGSYSGGSFGSNGSRNSVYTKCTDCNGTGRCRHCSGRGTSILSGHTETCVVCNGSGRCKICYGRGKL